LDEDLIDYIDSDRTQKVDELVSLSLTIEWAWMDTIEMWRHLLVLCAGTFVIMARTSVSVLANDKVDISGLTIGMNVDDARKILKRDCLGELEDLRKPVFGMPFAVVLSCEYKGTILEATAENAQTLNLVTMEFRSNSDEKDIVDQISKRYGKQATAGVVSDYVWWLTDDRSIGLDLFSGKKKWFKIALSGGPKRRKDPEPVDGLPPEMR
jgi:hypothetical protein